MASTNSNPPTTRLSRFTINRSAIRQQRPPNAFSSRKDKLEEAKIYPSISAIREIWEEGKQKEKEKDTQFLMFH